MIESDDYKRGWYDGYQAAKKEANQISPYNIPVTTPPVSSSRCKTCGIDFGTGAWGYVCNHAKCPTKVTCGDQPYV